MTWAALNREAAAAPAIPGYGVEDQDHPAHDQDDPGSAPYIIGGPSEFGEDVREPPYGDSGAPATPGYGVEDQDHPAHQGQVGRQASLMTLVRQKAAKALKLAKATLGKSACEAAIEDQAFDYMSMDDEKLDASLARLSGGFLAEDEDPMAGFAPKADDADPVMARLTALEDELQALRMAAQNDPTGPTLGTSGKSEQEEKKDEKVVSDKAARAKLARLFTACDLDNDGFVTQDDWMGPPEVFNDLDMDGDGILAKHEVLAGEVPEAFKKQWDKKDEDKKDEKESGKKAAKKSNDDEDADDKAAGKKGGKKSEEEPKDEKTEGKKSGKKASEDEDADDKKESVKKAFGHLADFSEDELEMLAAAQYGLDEGEDEGKEASKKSDEDEDADDVGGDSDPKEASKKSDDDEDADDVGGDSDPDEDEADKEASFFATGFDPMGLADGTELTAADQAAFREVFGSEDDDADDVGGDSDPKEGEDKAEKEANQRLASLLKPQPRKPSTGVRSVGAVGKTASTGGEVGELSKLWATDPDVSGSFR